MAGVAIIGQPNIKEKRIDNAIEIPGALSFLAYGTFDSIVVGLDKFDPKDWPDNIELLYYSFHIMITLGTLFILIMAYASFENWRGALFTNRWLLWVLMLAFPFPYIANTLGWMTAELGRQPWLIYGHLSHQRRIQQSRQQRRYDFHVDRLYRALLCARTAFSFRSWDVRLPTAPDNEIAEGGKEMVE